MHIELLFLLATGGIFCFWGLRIWKFNKIKLIHDYHYKNVAEENRPAYTRQIGKGVLLMGCGMASTGVVDFFTNSSAGWVLFVLGFTFGIIIIVRAQKKYNGGLGLF